MGDEAIVIVPTDVAYVVPVTKLKAVCTCGWEQLHDNVTNANYDAQRHQREYHPKPTPQNEPTTHDLIRELREAIGLFAGAMPITPEAAWEEAVNRVKVLRQRAGF